MKKKKISKNKMAALLKTSCTQVDRLLDPKNDITLSSLQRAAAKVDLDDYLAALLVGEKSNTGHGG